MWSWNTVGCWICSRWGWGGREMKWVLMMPPTTKPFRIWLTLLFKTTLPCPTSDFWTFRSSNQWLTNPKSSSSPNNLEREFNTEIEGQEGDEMDRVRQNGVNMIWWITCSIRILVKREILSNIQSWKEKKKGLLRLISPGTGRQSSILPCFQFCHRSGGSRLLLPRWRLPLFLEPVLNEL